MPTLRSASICFNLQAALLLSILILLPATARSEVRPYPDPGYGLLGIYGNGPHWIDFEMPKINLRQDTFPDKQKWWAGLKASREDKSSPHDIYYIFPGFWQGDATLEQCIQRVDSWLKPEPGIETYPELIPAISLAEENIPRKNPIMDGLARHIRDTYGIAVFQFYSDPIPPNPAIAADGWLWDSYFWEEARFRRHVMKFVVLGKPVNCTVWATDPHWPNYAPGRYSRAEDLINETDIQLRICKEFNVPVALFAVAGEQGALNPWLSNRHPDMVTLRNWIRTRQAQMHEVKPGELPMASANYSHRPRAIPTGGPPEAPSLYEETFDRFQWIDDAGITGFLNLRLTSEPEERPGNLLLKTRANEPAEATLTYRFESLFPLTSVQVTLVGAAPAAANARNEIALSLDEEAWPLRQDQAGNHAIETIRLEADESFLRGTRAFFVRVSVSNHAGEPGLAANRLDRLAVRCEYKPPPAGAAAMLFHDLYGNLSYDDDFSTPHWMHFGEVETAVASHGGHRDHDFWVGSVAGRPVTTEVRQRITSPREMKELTVAVNCHANSRDLASSVRLAVAPRGEPPRWTLQTSGPVHRGELALTVPPEDLEDLRDFDVQVRLHSGSGVEGGKRAAAALRSLSIRGRTAR